MTLSQATIRIRSAALLDSIWWIEGSGGKWANVGIEGTPDSWRVVHIRLDSSDKEYVVIDLERDE